MDATGPFSMAVVNGAHVAGKDHARLETEAAYRALGLLKSKLGSKGVLDLLAPDLEATDRAFEAWVGESRDEWVGAGVEYEVKGLDPEFWVGWLQSHLDDQDLQFRIHPEHYIWARADRVDVGYARGDYMIVEPYGTWLRRSYAEIRPWPGVEALYDPDYPIRMCVAGYLRSGAWIGRSIAQYRHCPGGFRMKFLSQRPAAIPAIATAGEHGLVEYRNYMLAARKDWIDQVYLT